MLPIPDSMEEATVDCLLNEDNRTWNHEMMDGIFVPEEGELIKKIPLTKNAGVDAVLWPMTEDGQYTSKSGYRFLKEQEGGLAVGACKHSLPTKCNLVCRKVILDHHCDRCTAAPENILHAIWSCSELDVVWESVDWDFRSRVQVQDVRELVTWILDNGKRAELFTVTAWCVWQ